MHSLFVYGTLRPQQPNAHVMERIGGSWTAAYILGHLQQRGWGLNLVARVFSSVIRARLFRVMYLYLSIFPNIGKSWMRLKVMNINGFRLKYIWKTAR